MSLTKDEKRNMKRAQQQELMEKLAVLRKLNEITEGKRDLKKTLDLILNPENMQTSSILSDMEVGMVADCVWLGDTWDCFKGLKRWVLEYAETKISKQGIGRKEAIDFTAASHEKHVLPFAMSIGGEKGKEEKGKK